MQRKFSPRGPRQSNLSACRRELRRAQGLEARPQQHAVHAPSPQKKSKESAGQMSTDILRSPEWQAFLMMRLQDTAQHAVLQIAFLVSRPPHMDSRLSVTRLHEVKSLDYFIRVSSAGGRLRYLIFLLFSGVCTQAQAIDGSQHRLLILFSSSIRVQLRCPLSFGLTFLVVSRSRRSIGGFPTGSRRARTPTPLLSFSGVYVLPRNGFPLPLGHGRNAGGALDLVVVSFLLWTLVGFVWHSSAFSIAVPGVQTSAFLSAQPLPASSFQERSCDHHATFVFSSQGKAVDERTWHQ